MLLWRMREARVPVTPKSILIPPLGMSTGLLNRHVGEDVVDQVRGAFSHAPPATTQTEPAPFAREGHEPLGRAARAPEPREAARQEAAAQERPELRFDEPRNALVAQARGLGEEALDMRVDHRMDGGGTRVAWRVLDGGHATRSAASVPPCSAAENARPRADRPRPDADAAYSRARAGGRNMNEVRRTCGIGHVRRNTRNDSNDIMTGSQTAEHGVGTTEPPLPPSLRSQWISF